MRDVLSEAAAESIKQLAIAHGARNVRVIEPAKEGAEAEGGLRLLVDMAKGRSLFDLVALSDELGEALGVEVGVWTEGSLSPYLREAILSRAVPLGNA